jgi:hypothetical protein
MTWHNSTRTVTKLFNYRALICYKVSVFLMKKWVLSNKVTQIRITIVNIKMEPLSTNE